ncbi:MAG: 1-(5-phosphoribosyl)-5-[(5-phosphoribosylamino)methylideneamino]imidazole-4-carboxamide isomerase, partial [Pirellulales bacterium]
MRIWPAIDLRGGKCVRLRQGDYRRETVFGEDPAAMALHWASQGAQCLHLVDLDGARSGQVENWPSIAAIIAAVDIPCELGGGVRDLATIQRLFDAGIARVVIGTLALKEPDWFRQMCRQFPQRIALGLDARKGAVATEGWLETSHTSALDLALRFADEPLAAIIYTDIDTDGMLSGPNFDGISKLQQAVNVPVVASGGVTTGEDVAQLAALGVTDCIIGRALYEETLTLADALRRARP